MIQAVIFDFDFTLGDSAKGIIQCAQAALKALGDPPAQEQAIRKTIGLSLKNTCVALTGRDVTEEKELFARVFRETADVVMTPSTELYPGAAALLRELHGRGCRVGIVTTKFHYRIEQILQKFGLTDVVDVIVGAEDVQATKPAPEGLLHAVKVLGLTVQDALYVGDNTVDAQAAQNAGMAFAGVLTGTTTEEEFRRYPHVRIADDLSGIRDLLA